MVWWLLLACVQGTPRESGVPVHTARAIVRECPTTRRPPLPARPGPAIPESAARELADLALAVDEPFTTSSGLLDLTLVIDRSGSMEEDGRMTLVKRSILQLLTRLRPGDRLNLVTFDNEVCVPLEDWIAGRDDPGLVQDVVAAMAPRGSTDLPLGLHTGYRVATRGSSVTGPPRPHRLLLITDALVTSGDLPPATLVEVERAWAGNQIALSTVGVGRTAQEPLLADLARRGGGAHRYLGIGPSASTDDNAPTTSRAEPAPGDPR